MYMLMEYQLHNKPVINNELCGKTSCSSRTEETKRCENDNCVQTTGTVASTVTTADDVFT